MGGWGSGSWQSGKRTTSDMQALDVRRLQRKGLLKTGQWFTWRWFINEEEISSIQIRSFSERLMLSYRTRSHDGQWQSFEYPVHLVTTPCHLGGQRTWFMCPARGCGRRVAVLYGGTIFACRECHRLAYPSQRERLNDRTLRQAEKIRKRLRWEPGIGNLEGGKPKGMHWRTFKKLAAQHDICAQACWDGVAKRLGVLEARLRRNQLGADDLGVF